MEKDPNYLESDVTVETHALHIGSPDIMQDRGNKQAAISAVSNVHGRAPTPPREAIPSHRSTEAPAPIPTDTLRLECIESLSVHAASQDQRSRTRRWAHRLLDLFASQSIPIIALIVTIFGLCFLGLKQWRLQEQSLLSANAQICVNWPQNDGEYPEGCDSLVQRWSASLKEKAEVRTGNTGGSEEHDEL